MSPAASAALLSAAQSDKPRVSVRTDYLREVLAAEQKAAADLHFTAGEVTTREIIVREQGSRICDLVAERDDLTAANHEQAVSISRLLAARAELRNHLGEARQDAEVHGSLACSLATRLAERPTWLELLTSLALLPLAAVAGMLVRHS